MASSGSALINILEQIGSEGVQEPREQVLLWLLRHQYEVGSADSYEYVLPAGTEISAGIGLDGAVVVQRREVTACVYLLFDADADRLKRKAKALAGYLEAEGQPESRAAAVSPRLRSIFEAATGRASGSVVRTVVCVSLNNVPTTARNAIKRIGVDKNFTIDVFDGAFLTQVAQAAAAGATQEHDIEIELHNGIALDLAMGDTLGLVLPVRAADVAKWPGIDDRSLFDLNVRHALGVNKVRKSLDTALVSQEGSHEFIAYHNGLTAVCRNFSIEGDVLAVHGISVVNGAQSVVAMHANAGRIPAEVRVLLKLIQARPETPLARQIAIRSNTQNPVTSRNLRALEPVQERLVREVNEIGYLYLVRPDQESPSNDRVIKNDDAAQLLCSVYVRKPALAVKRQVLFEEPLYAEIFPADLDAARVVFVHVLRQAVEAAKPDVPDTYQRAWALSSLALVFMASEAMRSDKLFGSILSEPRVEVRSVEQLRRDMAPFVEASCTVLHTRRAKYSDSTGDDFDDFKVAFKQTRTLHELGSSAAQAYRRASRAARA